MAYQYYATRVQLPAKDEFLSSLVLIILYFCLVVVYSPKDWFPYICDFLLFAAGTDQRYLTELREFQHHTEN